MGTESAPRLPSALTTTSFNSSPKEHHENPAPGFGSRNLFGDLWAQRNEQRPVPQHLAENKVSDFFSEQTLPAFPFLPPLCIQDKRPSDHLQWQPQRVT